MIIQCCKIVPFYNRAPSGSSGTPVDQPFTTRQTLLPANLDTWVAESLLQRMLPGAYGYPHSNTEFIPIPLQLNTVGKHAVGKQLIRRAVNLLDRKKNRLTTPEILLLMT